MKFDELCSRVNHRLPGLVGTPWDVHQVIKRYGTASHGERIMLAFLLGVWNPSTKWDSIARDFKPFDLFEAAACLRPRAAGDHRALDHHAALSLADLAPQSAH